MLKRFIFTMAIILWCCLQFYTNMIQKRFNNVITMIKVVNLLTTYLFVGH